MRLLAISDGFGDSNSAPQWYQKYYRWPDLVRFMTAGVEVVNVSRWAAGNEYMTNQLKSRYKQFDCALIQWTVPNRFDMLLTEKNHNHWKPIIESDPLYKHTVVDWDKQKFWLSSDSPLPEIRNYHQQYVSKEQHQMRSQLYIEYAKLLLESENKKHGFMLVENSEYLNVDANWLWHEPRKGMNDFKKQSRYWELDLGFYNPLPLISFDFVKNFVMPNIDLNWRNARDIDAVENMLYRHYQEALKNRPNDTN